MIVKLSWTSMSLWARHEYDDAIASYLGKPIPSSPQMELGNMLHKKWASHIEKNKTIPTELLHPDERENPPVLKNPIVEQFFGVTLPFSDKYQIHVISRIDLYDQPIVRDWKAGKSIPGIYLPQDRATQLGMYQLTLEANGHEVNEGRIVCFNPYTKRVETGIQYLNDRTKEQTLDFIMTVGGEMIPHLESQGLLKDYNPNWRNEPASQKAINYLRFLGGTVTEGMTAAQCSDAIDAIKNLKKETA